MRKLKIILITLSLSFSAFAQKIDTIQKGTQQYYLQKSLKQKSGGNSLAGLGIAALLITFVSDVSGSVKSFTTVVGSLGREQYAHRSHTIAYVLSGSAIVGGIYLNQAAKRNYKKGKSLSTSAFIKMEKAPVLQGNIIGNHSYPSVAIHINIH
jgi:hypothetical protein